MEDYIKTFDDLPIWAKILLALPVVDLVWGLYRLFKSIKNQHSVGIILAIVLILFASFWFIVDIVSLAVQGKVIWFEDTKTENKTDAE